jgi:hypothetical protein
MVHASRWSGAMCCDRFNLRRFVARQVQVNCGKRRFWFSTRFWGVETAAKKERMT